MKRVDNRLGYWICNDCMAMVNETAWFYSVDVVSAKLENAVDDVVLWQLQHHVQEEICLNTDDV